MQRTIYECDHCKVELGNVNHVSLHVANNGNASGIALAPDATRSMWKVSGFPMNFIHLHFKCVAPYFNALRKKVEQKKK